MRYVRKEENWERQFDWFRLGDANFSVFGSPLWTFFPNMRAYFRPIRDNHIQDSKTLEQAVAFNMVIAVLSLEKRVLFSTKQEYLGLAPEEARLGDVVVVRYGCKFPVVLRLAADGIYKLIGECYVASIIDGEIVDGRDRGEYEEVTLTLS